VILGAIFLSLIAARTTLDLVELELTGYDGLIVVAALGMVVFVIIPTCFVLSFDRRSLTWLDITLAIYFCAEFILLVLLSRASAGAWFNYGIQGTVFASVVTARALARICANAVSPWVAPLFGLAALMVLVGVCENARETVNARNAERIVVAHIINHYQAPASVFFFVERPGLNRLHGLLNLVYDEWLYPVFEAVHLAQPRSIWLQSALTAGDIRFVVNKTESNKIDGLGKTLPQMGYRPGLKVGADYYVWQRLPFDADPASR
jgi:preprotein translocase subunit SecG